MQAQIAKYAAIACFGLAAVIALVGLFEVQARLPRPQPQPQQTAPPTTVVTAPVGAWSTEVHIPAHHCVVWNPMPASDTYRVQTYWNTTWTDYTGGKPESTHFRIRSQTDKPVTVVFRPVGTC